MSLSHDTIVSRATPPGVGAMAVIRCSGPLSTLALEKCFIPASLTSDQPYRLRLGHWKHPETGDIIDQVLAVRAPAPNSFTGEDVIEAHCHGGPAVVSAVIASIKACGARPAGPGEFTRRAFLNGKMDLAQAEAVADLIQARTARAHHIAMRQLDGKLSHEVEEMRRLLIDVIAEMEAWLDFPEDDLPPSDHDRLRASILALEKKTRRQALLGERGRLFREGARVVIAGAPNAGKSSLFNALLGRERAIVSPHPGTTRDTIECAIDLNGLALILVDTAGLRTNSAEEIERVGIERATGEIHGADIVVWLEDIAGESEIPAAPDIPRGDQTTWLRVGTKSDLLGAETLTDQRRDYDVIISAATGEGMEGLESLLTAILIGEETAFDGADEDVLASNSRHIEALVNAAVALQRAGQAFDRGESEELVAMDLRMALDALSAILGLDVGDAVLDAIFSRFCIGK